MWVLFAVVVSITYNCHLKISDRKLQFQGNIENKIGCVLLLAVSIFRSIYYHTC
jgi:hypothetical protein